ncbi:hypothetical protein PHYSODRAFT_311948 [Phytophthora sojae]|uniref:Uncharacterized protein n=1 Tax=Phytophthora sojae (strain P6497) TaxID=1094619 RepID=G4YUQ0_PHYSP|nr:hypothetical protein PHYSODRAFT_311948 [Phytophthora sojae]EGZ25505.1 hypothetical protein PHYSODRAFT_311948 [Phytophthora sojae]|eukprot:XP_009520793.1 hypothetical protein PHYSODRAFT_311948 [Phytophthora sojae]
MLQSLHDQVCAQSSVSSRSGLHLDTMIDELFARPEVHRGLVQWLPEARAQQDAETLVAELRDDLVTGDGNEARTTLNKLLPLYIEALRAQEVLEQYSDTRLPTASPGGKGGDKRLLGHLVLREMQPFLETIQMAYQEVLSERDGVDVKETAKRLKAALFMFLNTANFASHNRGKLSYCQRIELCGAVGGMTETLPVIFQVTQVVQAALRVCIDNASSSSCHGCDKSHSAFEALNYNPLVMTLKCPVPESCRHDAIHKKCVCLFNHGEYKGAGTLRWCKKNLCRNLSSCSDPNCLRSHSLAEVCWMNPMFRTATCPEGQKCSMKQNCSLFHQEYHSYKRKVGKNDKVPVQLPPELGMPTRPFASSRRPPSLVQYYQQQLRAQARFSGPEQAKYSNVLKHMELLPKARMCLDGGQCASVVGGDAQFNPLAIVLACPTPTNCRDDSIHKNDLCVFYHGDAAVPKDFLKTKRLFCADAADCKDAHCVKTHSVAEVCWFFPIFRLYKCPQDQQCKRMGNCSYFHEEFHPKRGQSMNEVVGKVASALFVERGYAELQGITAPAAPIMLDSHTNGDEEIDVDDSRHLREEQPNSELLSTEDVHSDSSNLSGSAGGEVAAQLLMDTATFTLIGHEITLEGYSSDERAKYESVFAQMQQVPRARLCAQGEDCASLSSAGDASSCLESHSRLEALALNPLAMVLKCPINADDHQPSLCIFDHGNESIPDDFLTEKKSLCEERAHCTDARCAKLHSLAEVCWFNPDFRVNVCPDEDQCPHKFSCSGFHADRHASQRNAAMNNQVGLSEEILFVERTCTELAKRQAEALPGIFAWLRHQVVSKMPGSDLSSNPPK